MNHHASSSKARGLTRPAHPPQASVDSHAAALAPPAYGIALADRGGEARMSPPGMGGSNNAGALCGEVSAGLDRSAPQPALRAWAPARPAVVQRYTEENVGGDLTRMADDQTAAVTQESQYGSHELFAEAGLIANAQQKLKAVESGIELQIADGTLKIPQANGGGRTLKQVWPRNKQNLTGGIQRPTSKEKIDALVAGKPVPQPKVKMMQLWADCGKSNGVVLGGTSRRAVFEAQTDDTVETTQVGSPAKMKAQVLMKILTEVAELAEAELKKLGAKDPDRPAYESDIKRIRDAEKQVQVKWEAVAELLKKAATDDDWAKLRRAYDQIANDVLTAYHSFSPADRDTMNRNAGINEYANPEIGQGFTISSGGAKVPNHSTWNFHWAGVILKSADGADSVTLENYAVGDPKVENDEWVFQMYGHAQKAQSFHRQHQATGQHGKTPTTMAVENVRTQK